MSAAATRAWQCAFIAPHFHIRFHLPEIRRQRPAVDMVWINISFCIDKQQLPLLLPTYFINIALD